MLAEKERTEFGRTNFLSDARIGCCETQFSSMVQYTELNGEAQRRAEKLTVEAVPDQRMREAERRLFRVYNAAEIPPGHDA